VILKVILIISGIYAIVIGIGIVGLWSMLILTNQAPELRTEPVAIKFHIAAELSMGILSIFSGIFLLIGFSWAPLVFILAMGLVIYAVINSAGYYAQNKQSAFVIMFGIILITSLSLVILNIFF
jgi:CHASE3 domain sensor protein